MAKHEHSHPDHKKHGGEASHAGNLKRGIHRDWRFWTAVVLMLVAMAVYVLSFDESFRPGGVEGSEFPAAAE